MSQNKSVEEVVEDFWNNAKDQENDWFYGMSLEHRQLFYNWSARELAPLLQQERQTSQQREREIVEMIIADYMEALGTVVLPKEVWLWIADINGKYLNKNLKENI